MNCPRCGTKMKYDSEIKVEGRTIVIYRCPKCNEMAHKEKK